MNYSVYIILVPSSRWRCRCITLCT